MARPVPAHLEERDRIAAELFGHGHRSAGAVSALLRALPTMPMDDVEQLIRRLEVPFNRYEFITLAATADERAAEIQRRFTPDELQAMLV